MAKTAGMGDNFYVGGYNLSGDIGSLSRLSTPVELLDVTDITQSGIDRLAGRRDGAIDFTSYFDTAAGKAHPVLSALPTTDIIATYARGTTIGNAALSMGGKQIGYDPSPGSGALTFNVSKLANGYGAEWGRLHTAGVRTDAEATAGTAVDHTLPTDFGLQAYLHVFTFTGTDATITIQESSDNAGDGYANVVGGAFTAVTAAPYSQRIATAVDLTVERYLKVTTTTAAGFTSMTFAVSIVRNVLTPRF
jgi:hypothetical protein